MWPGTLVTATGPSNTKPRGHVVAAHVDGCARPDGGACRCLWGWGSEGYGGHSALEEGRGGGGARAAAAAGTGGWRAGVVAVPALVKRLEGGWGGGWGAT